MRLHNPSPVRATRPSPLALTGESVVVSRLEASVSWIERILGEPARSIGLSRLDADGREELVYQEGPDDLDTPLGRLARGEAIISGRLSVVRLHEVPASALGVVPLLRDGEVFGLLEIVASQHVITERLAAVEAVADRMIDLDAPSGTIGAHVRHDQVAARVAALMRELLAETSRFEAVRAVARFWHRQGAASAAWMLDREGSPHRFVEALGVDEPTEQALRTSVDTASATTIVGSARSILGPSTPMVTHADEAVIVIAGPEVDRVCLETVDAILGLVLDRLAMGDAFADLTGSIDTGLAWTAHELRAPLLAVEKAIDSLAGSDARLPDRERGVLAASQVELRRLAEMVDAVLRWSVGAASIRPRPIDLVPLVHETVRSTMPEGDRRVTVDAADAATVCIDPQLVRIAVENLIRNAVDHTHGEIGVSVAVTAADVTVSVSDSGPGVPEGRRAAIFQPFVRGRHARGEGRGLGLFIAQRVVHAHGGTLWLEPRTGGSTFRMRFPRQAP